MMEGQRRRPLRGGNWFTRLGGKILRGVKDVAKEVYNEAKPIAKGALKNAIGRQIGDGRRKRVMRRPAVRARPRPAVRARQVGMARAPAKRKRVVRRAGARPMGGRGTVAYQEKVGNIAY